jgi:hypothetical protein
MFSGELSEVSTVAISNTFGLPASHKVLGSKLSHQLRHFKTRLSGLKINDPQHALRR